MKKMLKLLGWLPRWVSRRKKSVKPLTVDAAEIKELETLASRPL